MTTKASRRYSLALYGLAEEKGVLNQVSGDVENCISLIKSNRNLELFFHSPVIPKAKKMTVVTEIFKGNVSVMTLNFIQLLIERGRGELTLGIFEDFVNLKKERDGILDVKIKTAIDLNSEEREAMKKKIDEYTRKNGLLEFEKDKAIIGGFVAKIGDTILDGSIKRQLELLKEKFRQGEFLN